jgi:hypothetical protein
MWPGELGGAVAKRKAPPKRGLNQKKSPAEAGLKVEEK